MAKSGREKAGRGRRERKSRFRGIYWLPLLATGAAALATGGFMVKGLFPTPTEAPEATLILSAQESMPFQILIPGYLPRQFDRAGVGIKVNQNGPGGEPMVELAYRTHDGAALFVREWVPINPGMEVLAASRPIETKWGQGWMLTQGGGLTALWVDVGPLRASIYTSRTDVSSREDILAMADSLGPASNRQVFSFILNPPRIREVPPPPPFEVPVNAGGIQELTLVVTPGGYSPLRFAVKKDLPVRLTFKQLGRVGCGNELFFPADPRSPVALFLKTAFEKRVYDFTPRTAGDFQFFCSHQMYRGIMKVRE